MDNPLRPASKARNPWRCAALSPYWRITT